jgi:predicted DNA binding protein
MAPSSTMTPLSVYLPSDQVEVNENADFNEIEQLSISTDNEQEDQLDSTNKSFDVNSNDYVVDWKNLYYQSCQIIQSLETVNNSLNNAIKHYTR